VRRRTARQRSRQGSRVDPYISYLLLAGVGVGTWQMNRTWRQTLLWLLLLGAFLLYVEVRPVKPNYSLRSIGWGALLGAVVSVPLLLLAWRYLYGFVVQLFATDDARLLFYQLVLVGAPVEELYFRGLVQREKGMPLSIALYAAVALIYFVPGLHVPALAIVLITITYALTGSVYSYVYARHGLSAAVTSHAVFNLIALLLPFLLQYLARI